MGFRLNLNLNFNDVKMDKLYTEATKGSDIVLSSNPMDTIMNQNVNNPSKVLNMGQHTVETMDLSSSLNNGNSNVNVNGNAFSNVNGNQVAGSQTNVGTTHVNLDANQSNPTQGANLSSADARTNLSSGNVGTTQGSNLSASGTSTTNSGQNGMSFSSNSTTNSSSVGSMTGANFNSNGTMNSNFSNTSNGVQFDASKVGTMGNVNTDGMSTNTNAAGIQTGSSAMSSSQTGTSMNVNQNMTATAQGQGELAGNMNLGSDMDADMSTPVTSIDGKVVFVATDANGNQQTVEMDQDQYVQDLKNYGLNETDIRRIIFGEITLEKLMEEIQNDSDLTRQLDVLEAAYLQASGLGVTSMEELDLALNNIDTRLEALAAQKIAMANNHLDTEMKALQDQKELYQSAKEYIQGELTSYERENHYTSMTDFQENNQFQASSLERLNELKHRFQKMPLGATAGVPQLFVNDKQDIVDVISCMINEQGNLSGGYLEAGNVLVEVTSVDDIVSHYAKWAPHVTDTEKEVFNYIYRTEGTEAAYQYLEDLSTKVDNRWLASQMEKDQALAAEHPILASLGSIVVTPIEGIGAVCYSLRSRILDEKIRRTDVYSSGDIWRGQVSQDIGTNYGDGWAFVYNTGMSIADTGVLIGLTAITGGAATPVLSASVMGSRAYVSTLNDGLNRGLSDGSAVLLASSSAIVETMMESYSVGHLMNLESILGKGTNGVIQKVANSIANPKLASIATKTTYIAAASLSQGICEGEEEFSTEVLNYFADNLISGDLSNHTLALNGYLNAGYTEEEARKMANADFQAQLVQAFLGGFVSGICFGTFGGLKSVHSISETVASNIMADYSASDVEFQEAVTSDSKVMDHEVFGQSVDAAILAQINESSMDLKLFSQELEQIRNYTSETVPDGYSVDGYKQEFIRTLVDSGKINEMDNNYMFQLIKDPVMFHELIGTENLTYLYTKNLESLADRLVPTFDRLSQADFNEFFAGETMTNYIQQLDPSSLGKLLHEFQSSSPVSWLANETIMDRVVSMDVSDFYDFASGIGFYSPQIKAFLQNGNQVEQVSRLLEAVNQKFYTEQTVLGHFEYQKIVENLIPPNTNHEAINDQVKTFKATKKAISDEIRSMMASTSQIEVVEKNGSLVIPTHENYRYYNLSYEQNGVSHKVEMKTNLSNELELYSILNNPPIVNALVNGQFEIQSITPILSKSNLVLNERSGLKPGVNEILLDVNGVEEKIVVNSLRNELDLNRRFQNDTAVVKVVWSKGSFNVDVANQNALYRVNYILEDGQTIQGYLTTGSPVYDTNITDHTLNVDGYIQDHNLLGVANVELEEVLLNQVNDQFPMIDRYSASRDIYNDNQFGGNQGDVYYLLNDALNGVALPTIDASKANLLSQLIDHYFPNATDLQKIQLATDYANQGCFYTAVSNAFTTYMGSIENGPALFEQRFGYPLKMIDGTTVSYNTEALSFDMYLNYVSKKFHQDVAQFIQSNSDTGISEALFQPIVKGYFGDHGIQMNHEFISVSDSISNIDHTMLAAILNHPDGFHILSAKDFDLEQIGNQSVGRKIIDQSLENVDAVGKINKGVDRHAMLITGLDEQMNVTLSSWGKEYKLLTDSFKTYQLQGKPSKASILNFDFSVLPDATAVETTFHIDSTLNTESYHAMEFPKSKTEVLNQHSYLQEVKKHVRTVIDIMDEKYDFSGLERLESYLITGNISDITRHGNARSYIESLSKEDLTHAVNSYIVDNKAHELFLVKNNLTPQQAVVRYNEIIDSLKLPKGGGRWYSYQDYMAYVARCKKEGVSYFTNFSYLNAETQLQQLKNQFQYKKHYISLKTKEDIFSYFGNAGDHFYGEVIKGIKEISSESAHPITGLELEQIKEINYLEYIFSKPSKRLVKYLKMIKEKGFSEFKNAISNQDDSLTPETQQGILQYMQHSVQGKFISKLTVKEVLSIYEYTVGSGTILQWLAGVPMHSHYRIKDPIVLNNIIQGLDSAIMKYGGLKQNMILYRGDTFENLSLWKTINVNNYESLKKYVGQTILCEKYLSTGVSESGSFGGEVLWRIKAPIGTQGIYINDLSAYFNCPSEYEFVVKRRSELRIDRIYKKGDNVYIEAKIVGYR